MALQEHTTVLLMAMIPDHHDSAHVDQAATNIRLIDSEALNFASAWTNEPYSQQITDVQHFQFLPSILVLAGLSSSLH